MAESTACPTFRALILEDHAFQRDIGVQLLKQCGASNVIEAPDGATALDCIAAAPVPFDVVLCDLNMPGMDGLAFLRHIAERGCTSSVILASVLDSAIMRTVAIMAKSYGIRLVGVVDKPLSRAKLVPLLLRHFSQHLVKPRPAPALMALEEIAVGVERNQFMPFFQPKIDMRNGRMVGVEALMRWRHPEWGLMQPESFIPAMESGGLISKATLALAANALSQCSFWHDLGLDVPLAINVSVESLRDTDLADRLELLIDATGLTSASLTIEVTESAAMTDVGRSLETLARCRMKGFALSIDDYGTGFSSMRQLTRLPVSELKIDQAFVTGATSQPILQALIETSITMAKRLNLRTVAEGVETGEDWDLVAGLGCEVAQGYFIARPMAGEHLVEWYRNWLGIHRPSLAPGGSVAAR